MKQSLMSESQKSEKKQIIITNIRTIIVKVLRVMKNHIGEDNRISRNNLFKKVYGLRIIDVSELQEFIMWEMLKRAMHRCRQRTFCFIVSKPFPTSKYSVIGAGVWNFWVAKDMTDANTYRDNLNRNIKAMKNMMIKCDRAVIKEYWNKHWVYK